MKVLVAQKGAREHYATVRALQKRGMLAGLVSDWYATPSIRRIGKFMNGWMGGKERSAMAAWCEAIPDGSVQAFNFRSLYWKWRVHQSAARGGIYGAYLQTDAAFAQAAARLKLPPHQVFFGYSYASLEMMQAEKQRGVWTVLDQIDPGPLHFRVVGEEMKQHPELAGMAGDFPEAYFNRVRQEWALADVIVVNSEWSREAIISEGADARKIEVLPLGFETGGGSQTSACQPRTQGKLRVLWMGQVAPAKGIYYLVEAARLLKNSPVEITVAGSSQVRREFMAAAPANISWLGPVPRSETAKLYQQSDLFVLPTLSDGFAITQLEALSHGLPVVTTPNCGRVVDDGRTGFIVPPRNAQALAEAILRFQDRKLAAEMAARCRESVAGYSIDAYGRRLVEIIERRKRN